MEIVSYKVLIMGGPQAGKSSYLSALTHQMQPAVRCDAFELEAGSFNFIYRNKLAKINFYVSNNPAILSMKFDAVFLMLPLDNTEYIREIEKHRQFIRTHFGNVLIVYLFNKNDLVANYCANPSQKNIVLMSVKEKQNLYNPIKYVIKKMEQIQLQEIVVV